MSGFDDFTGFTFNGKHSYRDFHIYHVSSSNRYEDNIAPTPTDKTAEVAGVDGTFFFYSYNKSKTFKIDFAFDNVGEAELRAMRQAFSSKEVSELIFDEAPYKAWDAKISGTPSFKYICFDKVVGTETKRVYKGEGSIQFITYFPYAHTPRKLWTVSSEGTYSLSECDGRDLSNYSTNYYTNIGEWNGVIGLQSSGYGLINKGDIAAPFTATHSSAVSSAMTMTVDSNSIAIAAPPTGTTYYNILWDTRAAIVTATTTSSADADRIAINYTGKVQATIPITDTQIATTNVDTLDYKYWFL